MSRLDGVRRIVSRGNPRDARIEVSARLNVISLLTEVDGSPQLCSVLSLTRDQAIELAKALLEEALTHTRIRIL